MAGLRGVDTQRGVHGLACAGRLQESLANITQQLDDERTRGEAFAQNKRRLSQLEAALDSKKLVLYMRFV